MGGGVATAALAAGLVDEVILHQVPVLLGAGRASSKGSRFMWTSVCWKSSRHPA